MAVKYVMRWRPVFRTCGRCEFDVLMRARCAKMTMTRPNFPPLCNLGHVKKTPRRTTRSASRTSSHTYTRSCPMDTRAPFRNAYSASSSTSHPASTTSSPDRPVVSTSPRLRGSGVYLILVFSTSPRLRGPDISQGCPTTVTAGGVRWEGQYSTVH